MADLRKALEDLVAECREVQRYVNGEGSDDEADRFNDALKAAEVALTAGVPVLGEAQPDLWAIFDSQGFYEVRETEDEARKFCDHYNKRAFDPLKPYSFRRYVAAGVTVPAAPLPLAGLSPWLRSVASTMVEGEDRQAILRWSQEVDTVRGVPDGVEGFDEGQTPAGWRFKSREGGEWHFDSTEPTGHVFSVEPLYTRGVRACDEPSSKGGA